MNLKKNYFSHSDHVDLTKVLKISHVLPEFEDILQESYKLFKDNGKYHKEMKKAKKVKEKRGCKKKLNNECL